MTQEKETLAVLQLSGKVVSCPRHVLCRTGGPDDACGRIEDGRAEHDVLDRVHYRGCTMGKVREGQNEGSEEGKQGVEHRRCVKLKGR